MGKTEGPGGRNKVIRSQEVREDAKEGLKTRSHESGGSQAAIGADEGALGGKKESSIGYSRRRIGA